MHFTNKNFRQMTLNPFDTIELVIKPINSADERIMQL